MNRVFHKVKNVDSCNRRIIALLALGTDFWKPTKNIFRNPFLCFCAHPICFNTEKWAKCVLYPDKFRTLGVL